MSPSKVDRGAIEALRLVLSREGKQEGLSPELIALLTEFQARIDALSPPESDHPSAILSRLEMPVSSLQGEVGLNKTAQDAFDTVRRQFDNNAFATALFQAMWHFGTLASKGFAQGSVLQEACIANIKLCSSQIQKLFPENSLDLSLAYLALQEMYDQPSPNDELPVENLPTARLREPIQRFVEVSGQRVQMVCVGTHTDPSKPLLFVAATPVLQGMDPIVYYTSLAAGPEAVCRLSSQGLKAWLTKFLEQNSFANLDEHDKNTVLDLMGLIARIEARSPMHRRRRVVGDLIEEACIYAECPREGSQLFLKRYIEVIDDLRYCGITFRQGDYPIGNALPLTVRIMATSRGAFPDASGYWCIHPAFQNSRGHVLRNALWGKLGN